MKFIFGIFVILHGLVHLLYIGQSARYFELKSGMLWPDGSWIFSRFLGSEAVRSMASISLVLTAVALIVAGIAILAGQVWWRPLLVGAAVLSSLVYILFWNGRMQNLDAQGAVAILIDIAILLFVLVFRWSPAR